MTPARVSMRQLNRTTLQRQMLLERTPVDPVAAISHLVGLQSQNPLDPYAALWSRLTAFDPDQLGRALTDRTLVRIVTMRGTIHLMTSADALDARPLVQPVLDAEIRRHRDFGPPLQGVDLVPLLAEASDELARRPMSGTQLRAFLADRFPAVDAAALAYACRCHVALVQVPPRGVWGRTGQVTLTPLTSWVGAPLSAASTIDDLVVRYLRAFGPATVADAATWTRLTGLREVVERLGGRLRRYVDDRGRDLYDVADAPLADPDAPAPVRFLPEYDNALLSHADRSRFVAEGGIASTAGPIKGTVLVDGRVRGVWRTEERATVVVEHVGLARAHLDAVEGEGHRFAEFWLHDVADRDVRLQPLPG